MANSYWTQYGWVADYDENEVKHFQEKHKKAQETYIHPTPPVKRGECKYCGDKVEPESIICEDCYSVEF